MQRWSEFFSKASHTSLPSYFNKHLPDKLYHFLLEKNLLDGEARSFHSIMELNTIITISVTAKNRDSDINVEHVLIEMHKHKEASNSTHKFYYRHKIWLMEKFISTNNVEYSSGNEAVCQENTYTNKECRNVTPQKEISQLFQLGLIGIALKPGFDGVLQRSPQG